MDSGVGSISNKTPSVFSLRSTILARAPGAWQAFVTEKKTSRRGSDGSTAAGFSAGWGACAGGGASGMALDASASRAASEEELPGSFRT